MLRNTAALCAIALSATLTASADFSYTRTQKVTGGSMGAVSGTRLDQSGKYYFKGQKEAGVNGTTTTVIDFAAETITTIDNAQKTYKVQHYGGSQAAGLSADVKAEIKETGQTKVVNGFHASETLVTMEMDAGSARMQLEISIWTSTEVPGADEMREFYQKNVAGAVYAAMTSSNNMEAAIAKVHSKLAQLKGTPVQEVVRMKPVSGGPQAAAPQLTPEQQAKRQAVLAQIQAMAKDGAGAVALQQAMAAAGRGPVAANPGGPLLELTVDNTGFSTAAVADSEFVVPSDYRQVQ